MPDADPAAPVSERGPSMLTVARQPRMIALLLLFLAAAAVCGRLGVWQLDRAQERGRLAEQHAAAEAAASGDAPLADLLAPQTTFPGALVGRQARVEGEFDADEQLLVTGRALDGEVGYLVLTPLRVTDDGSGGASWADLSGPPVLPVVRGWVPQAVGDATGGPGAPLPEALVPPAGTVALTGYLQASESTGQTGIADGRTDAVSSAALANAWGGPIYSGYLVASGTDPAQPDAVALLPRPTIEGGDGINLQNLFYALQWWIFGGFAVALWLRLVRDETRLRNGDARVDPFAEQAARGI